MYAYMYSVTQPEENRVDKLLQMSVPHRRANMEVPVRTKPTTTHASVPAVTMVPTAKIT